MNRGFYDTLEAVLRATSLMVTFERTCILCDRPEEISSASVRFRDGYEVFFKHMGSAP